MRAPRSNLGGQGVNLVGVAVKRNRLANSNADKLFQMVWASLVGRASLGEGEGNGEQLCAWYNWFERLCSKFVCVAAGDLSGVLC